MFSSLDHFEISLWRIAGLGLLTAVAAALGAWLVVGDSLGHARTATSAVVAALVLYIILSTPRRILDGQRVSQARESPLLSASASTCLAVTGSRSRTLILLRPRDAVLAAALKDAARRVLLGTRVESVVDDSARALISYSAADSVRALAIFSPTAIEQGDEEARGLAASSDLSMETKVPMLMTVCFFAPILLVIYAVFSHSYDALKLGELVSFEFIVLDFAFYLSSSERGPR